MTRSLESKAGDDPIPISVIVGLGNPGTKYDQTRHNIGFMVVDCLAKSWQLSLGMQKKFKGNWAEKILANGDRLHLLKPNTFMNLSGESAIALVKWYKLKPESVLAIYDDMDLAIGKIRIKPSGSAGGHNGMKSLIAHLGSQNFPRLRLGIGAPQAKKSQSEKISSETDLNLSPNSSKDTTQVIGHVLGNFNAAETQALPELMRLAENAVSSILAEGMGKAMSKYNNCAIEIAPGKVTENYRP
jgi:peptidyl-tRNA hydrolase, PTH1 family